MTRCTGPWTLPDPWTHRPRPPVLGKPRTVFHKRPPPSLSVNELKTKNGPRLRAGEESDDTQTAYRVAAFQTFLSGRI